MSHEGALWALLAWLFGAALLGFACAWLLQHWRIREGEALANDLEADFARLSSAHIHLQTHADGERAARISADLRIRELNEALRLPRDQDDPADPARQAEAERRIAELQAERDGQSAALQALENECRQQQQTLQLLENERRQQHAALERNDSERAQQQAALQALDSEGRQQRVALEALESERRQLRAAIEALQSERRQQQEAIDALENERRQQQPALEALQNERRQLQAAIEALESERRQLQAAIEALQSERRQQQEAIEALQSERRQQQEAIEVLQNERRQQQDALRALDQERAQLQAALAEQVSETRALGERLRLAGQAQATPAGAGTREAALDEQLRQLMRERTDLEAECTALAAEARRAASEAARQQAAFASLQTECDALRNSPKPPAGQEKAPPAGNDRPGERLFGVPQTNAQQREIETLRAQYGTASERILELEQSIHALRLAAMAREADALRAPSVPASGSGQEAALPAAQDIEAQEMQQRMTQLRMREMEQQLAKARRQATDYRAEVGGLKNRILDLESRLQQLWDQTEGAGQRQSAEFPSPLQSAGNSSGAL